MQFSVSFFFHVHPPLFKKMPQEHVEKHFFSFGVFKCDKHPNMSSHHPIQVLFLVVMFWTPVFLLPTLCRKQQPSGPFNVTFWEYSPRNWVYKSFSDNSMWNELFFFKQTFTCKEITSGGKIDALISFFFL